MFGGHARMGTGRLLLAFTVLLTLFAFPIGGALADGGDEPMVVASGSGQAQAAPSIIVSNGGLSAESIAYIGQSTGSGCRQIYGKVTGQIFGAASGDVVYLEAGGALMYNIYGENYQAIQDTGNVPNATFVDTGWQGNNQTYCSGTWFQAGHSYFSVSGWEDNINEDAQYSF